MYEYVYVHARKLSLYISAQNAFGSSWVTPTFLTFKLNIL
jgi:hypothetical protein